MQSKHWLVFTCDSPPQRAAIPLKKENVILKVTTVNCLTIDFDCCFRPMGLDKNEARTKRGKP